MGDEARSLTLNWNVPPWSHQLNGWFLLASNCSSGRWRERRKGSGGASNDVGGRLFAFGVEKSWIVFCLLRQLASALG